MLARVVIAVALLLFPVAALARAEKRVGSYRPNLFGLHDMLRNVGEWVKDCWHRNYSGAPMNGDAWISSCSGSLRVIRGVAPFEQPQIYMRDANSPDARSNLYGFRVARNFEMTLAFRTAPAPHRP